MLHRGHVEATTLRTTTTTSTSLLKSPARKKSRRTKVVAACRTEPCFCGSPVLPHEDDKWICSQCNFPVHFRCVGLTERPTNNEGQWTCPKCLQKKNDSEPKYCVCELSEFGKMIPCCAPDCPLNGHCHAACVDMLNKEASPLWRCPMCSLDDLDPHESFCVCGRRDFGSMVECASKAGCKCNNWCHKVNFHK